MCFESRRRTAARDSKTPSREAREPRRRSPKPFLLHRRRRRVIDDDAYAFPRVHVSVWRVAWAALADGEPFSEKKARFPKLEESRARVAGLHTAMGVARCVVAAGPLVTRGA
jgi:hypothetical protein